MNNKRYHTIQALLKKRVSGIINLVHSESGAKNSIRVLQYHNITDKRVPEEWKQMTTSRDLFDAQMCYLKSNYYNVISADEVVDSLAKDKNIPPKTVCVTFDDGFRDNYINAFPILKKHELNGTIFITAGFVGKDEGQFGGYLNWDQIGEMKESGVIAFGYHSFSHKNLTRLKDAELIKEMRDGKIFLENNLKLRMKTFAYPFGWHSSFNNRVVDVLKKEGFSCAFTGIYGVNTKNTNPYMLRRIGISWFNELDEFKKVLNGSYDWYSIYQKMISIWKKPL